jgi:hypothetical protein
MNPGHQRNAILVMDKTRTIGQVYHAMLAGAQEGKIRTNNILAFVIRPIFAQRESATIASLWQMGP